MIDLESMIRDVPDFARKGIVFKDITTLLKDRAAYLQAVNEMVDPFRNEKIDLIVGVESRGFIFGGAMAYAMNTGFITARKQGKLPADTVKEEYALEYGADAIEIHRDGISRGMRVLIVDDLLATGGTASATVRLVERLGGVIVGVVFLIELGFLNGREKLKGVPVRAILNFVQ